MLYYIELAFGLSLYNYIGNRWLGHSGLAMYDNTARMHDPLLMRFVSPDPLYAKFGSLSPWSHCAANPLNLIDPDGNELQYVSTAIEDIKKVADVWQGQIGKVATVGYDSNGSLSMENFDATKGTQNEVYIASILKGMIDNDNTAKINVVRDNKDVLIGDFSTATMDLGDAERFDKYVPQGLIRVIVHETVEQFEHQINGKSSTDAHRTATNREQGALNNPDQGSLRLDTDTQNGIGKFYYKHFSPLDNGRQHKEDKIIEIPYSNGNIEDK